MTERDCCDGGVSERIWGDRQILFIDLDGGYKCVYFITILSYAHLFYVVFRSYNSVFYFAKEIRKTPFTNKISIFNLKKEEEKG